MTAASLDSFFSGFEGHVSEQFVMAYMAQHKQSTFQDMNSYMCDRLGIKSPDAIGQHRNEVMSRFHDLYIEGWLDIVAQVPSPFPGKTRSLYQINETKKPRRLEGVELLRAQLAEARSMLDDALARLMATDRECLPEFGWAIDLHLDDGRSTLAFFHQRELAKKTLRQWRTERTKNKMPGTLELVLVTS